MTDRLAALLDLLLPGDGVFPSAGAAGIAPVVASRLGPEALARIPAGLADATAVAALEAADPELFERLARTAYLTYYGTEAVAAALRATGLDYHLTPQPQGYALPPFDPAVDAPRRARGRYVATAAVRRVALPEGLVP